MRKIRDEQKGIFFILLILIIVVGVVIIFARLLKSNTVLETINNNEVVRTLFVIEDADSEVLFSNVVVYYPSSHKAAVINIPCYVGSIFQSLGRVDKIETIYKEKGIDTYKREVENLLGISIPFWVVINQDDFIKLSDYLGGMRVFIPSPIDIVDESGHRWLLPSGAVGLDGDKIYTYLHYSVPEENISDVQDRFQNVMIAFLTCLNDKKFIIFQKKNNKVFTDCVNSNVDEEEERTLFQILSEMDVESIIKQTITGSIRNVDDAQLLFPLNNGEFIKEAVKQTTNMLISTDGSLTSRVYVLEIQNGTTIQGLARNTSILFQNASYDVLSAVNAKSNDYENTVIIDHIGNKEVAKMVGEFIHCTNIQNADENMEENDISTDTSVDFTIILGKDFNGRYVVKKS